MSEYIKFTMKDGAVREFRHRGRPGGSYTIRLSFEGAFAIVTDEYGTRTCIPAADISEVREDQGSRY